MEVLLCIHTNGFSEGMYIVPKGKFLVIFVGIGIQERNINKYF